MTTHLVRVDPDDPDIGTAPTQAVSVPYPSNDNHRDIAVITSEGGSNVDNKEGPKFCSNAIITHRYSVLTFLPINLFEQFRRVSNFWFLLVCIVMYIPGVDALAPVTSVFPLLFIISVSAIKDAYEDYQRWKSDSIENAKIGRLVRIPNEKENNKNVDSKFKTWIFKWYQHCCPCLPENNNELTEISSISKNYNKPNVNITRTIDSNAQLIRNVPFSSLRVGDIVRVEDGDDFPADMILLASSGCGGVCYVQTANLDGESSHQPKNVPTLYQLSQISSGLSSEDMGIHDDSCSDAESYDADVEDKTQSEKRCNVGVRVIHNFSGSRISCEEPNKDLYSFHGYIDVMNCIPRAPLETSNLLLRGSRLVDTRFIYGVVVYTGHDTKIMRNSGFRIGKFSDVEKSVNSAVILVIAIIIGLSALLAGGSLAWTKTHVKEDWYLGLHLPSKDVFSQFCMSFLNIIVLINQGVPASLMVTIELVRNVYSFQISLDDDLVEYRTQSWRVTEGRRQLMTASDVEDDVDIIRAQCRSSNVLEDMGLVRHIFTDKTGTLTENIMRVAFCSVRFDSMYVSRFSFGSGDSDVLPLAEGVVMDQSDKISLRYMLECIALCHSVRPVERNKVNRSHSSSFLGESVDEISLVEAASQCGFHLTSRTLESLTLSFAKDEHVVYRILHVIPFTSQRRRMSVLVQRLPNGQPFLICKGADESVLPITKDVYHSMGYAEAVSLGCLGMRVLVFASGNPSSDLIQEVMSAKQLPGRQRLMAFEKLAPLLESDLSLVGITGIEDILQAEVPETLHSLYRAGCTTWMLTGDQLQTACSVATACGLLPIGISTIRLCSDVVKSSDTALNLIKQGSSLIEAGLQPVLIIDGAALNWWILSDEEVTRAMVELSEFCFSIICARLSPSEKASLVRSVRRWGRGGPCTLAIGDGGNDVGMIQEANIGVGIQGREGMQAVQVSDLRIGSFRHLRRLVLVHGRYDYMRLSFLVQYVLYKSMALVLPVVFFSFLSAFSSTNFYDQLLMMMYNVFYTALPPLVVAVTDWDLSPEMLFRYPELHRSLQRREPFCTSTMLGWTFVAVMHSILIFVAAGVLFGDCSIMINGDSATFSGQSMFAMVVCVEVVLFTLAIEVRTWNPLIIFFLCLSMLAYFGWSAVISVFPDTPVLDSAYGTFSVMASSPSFWLAQIATVGISALLSTAYHIFRRWDFPTAADKIRELMELDRVQQKEREMTHGAEESGWEPLIEAAPTSSNPYGTFN